MARAWWTHVGGDETAGGSAPFSGGRFLGKENNDNKIKKKIDIVKIHLWLFFVCFFGNDFRHKSPVWSAGAACDFAHMNFYPYSPMTSAEICLSMRWQLPNLEGEKRKRKK